jgi:hypothetical protein
MGGGPAGEQWTYQMRRGRRSCRRYGGSGAFPAAWKSWEDGGARLVERSFPSTPLDCPVIKPSSQSSCKSYTCGMWVVLDLQSPLT